MQTAFSDMVGNERLRLRLAEDIQAGTLSHAYILEGDAGCGKHMLAYRIASALNCRNRGNGTLPCMHCDSCRKILDGNSPDVIFVNRGERATFGVDAVRGLKSDVYIAPNELDTKIYILEEAHLLTPQAQNAFLLTLEEPPAYVLFLLLAEHTDTLLETVKSRAPILRMERQDAETMGMHLRRTVPEASLLSRNDPDAFAELLVAANGSIGRAMLLLDEKKRRPVLDCRANAKQFLNLAATRRSTNDAIQLIRSLPTKREELIPHLSEILPALRDLLVSKQSENAPLCFFAKRTEAEELSYRFTVPELLHLTDCVSEAIDALRGNANVRLTLTALAVRCGLLQ